MSNRIKQLKDSKGQAFDPYTSIEAIKTDSISGGNILVINDSGTGVEASETKLEDVIQGKGNVYHVQYIVEIPDETLDTLQTGDIVCCDTLNNAFIVTKNAMIGETVKILDLCCPAEDTNCDAAYISYRWEQGVNNNLWQTNGLFHFTNYIRLLQGTVDNQTHNSTVMDSNAVYNYGTLSGDVTFRLETLNNLNANEANIWCWTFDTGATPPTVTWPAQVTSWGDGDAPELEPNKHYEISVMGALGLVASADLQANNNNE